MKRKWFFIIGLAVFILFNSSLALAWTVVADPYLNDGNTGIPTHFVVRIDDGAEQVISAVNPASYPAFFTPPTGGFPTGSAAFVFNVDAYRGRHSLTAKARNAEGDSAWSSPFPFDVPRIATSPAGYRLVR